MSRTIKVTGTGNISVKADLIRFVIESEETYPKYEDALSHSASDTSVLREAIGKAGLDQNELKTIKFYISTSYESYKDKYGDYKSKLVGYKYFHRTYIEFENDNTLLGRLIYNLAICPLDVDFEIHYTIKDQGAVKDELLRKCIEDSRKKADLMADAAGVKIGQVLSIDYSWNEVVFSKKIVSEYYLDSTDMIETSGYNIDIMADDLKLTDTVTIEWEIEG